MYIHVSRARAILTVTHVHAPVPLIVVSSSSSVLPQERRATARGRGREIKEDGVRFCARVQRLRVGREGGTSITRYIDRKGGWRRWRLESSREGCGQE